MRGPGRGALVAGLVALLFGVIAGFEISVHAEYDERHEKPKFDSFLELATKEKLHVMHRDVDYLKFSQRWPGTYCKQPGSCCKNVAKPTIFTVNGLWPEYNDGSYPSCCRGPAFDQNQLVSVVRDLKYYWPKVNCSSPTKCNGEKTGSLWEQEWQKHGTCLLAPGAKDKEEAVYYYFYFSVYLAQEYDIAQILKRAGFVPDSSEQYNTSQMIAAVKSEVGGNPAFTCKSNEIYEIQICFNGDFDVQDCPPVPSADSCPPTLVFAPFES